MNGDDPAGDAEHPERDAVRISEVERDILGADPPSSPRKRREAKNDRIRREQREADEFWRGLLNSGPVARRELWRLIAGPTNAHAFDTRWMVSPSGMPNQQATDYARGEQDFGLRLYHAWLRLDASAVALMHAENDQRFAGLIND